jgi:hypothetical protein
MYTNKNILTLCGFVLLAILFGCKQGEPPIVIAPEIKGDIAFAGYQWKYKNATTPVGPGPNRFVGDTNFIQVDANGALHLKIAKKNNVWCCSEIISTKVFGYGTYIFTCASDISTFNENAVFGLFTWDSYSFQKQGNSEIDIEFSKWGKATDTNLVTYSAQPVIFSNPTPYYERTFKPTIASKYISKPMTYMFKWTADSVHWESYEGTTYPGVKKVSEWTFNNSNIARKKIEGTLSSDPIIVPAPSDSTNVRFNLWLLNGLAPSNGQEHEVIISSFKYIPE